MHCRLDSVASALDPYSSLPRLLTLMRPSHMGSLPRVSENPSQKFCAAKRVKGDRVSQPARAQLADDKET